MECLFQSLQEKGQPAGYPDVSSLGQGCCPYCGKSLTTSSYKDRANITKHLLKCHTLLLLRQRISDNQHPRVCLWEGCTSYCQVFQVNELAAHNNHHLSDVISQPGPLQCPWRDCAQICPDTGKLIDYLCQQHCFYSLETAPDISFCHQCAAWFYCRFDWERHCQEHLDRLDECCGRLTWRSCLIFPPNCLFCLASSNLPPSDRYRQFFKTGTLASHIWSHVIQELPRLRKCPHLCCQFDIKSLEVLLTYFVEVHSVPLAGVVVPTSQKADTDCI